MGCFSTAVVVPEKSVKVYRRIAVNLYATFCILEVDSQKWKLVCTNFQQLQWKVTLPDGSKTETDKVVEFVDATLKSILEVSPAVRVDELCMGNWFASCYLFTSVEIGKLQVVSSLAPYVPGFLSMFLGKKLTHLTVVNFFKDSAILDELKRFEVDYLLVMTDTQDDRSKLTGFRAKRWDISEGLPEQGEERIPFILPFVEKMMNEKSQIKCKYYGYYKTPLNIGDLVEEVKKKYPEAKYCVDGRQLLTIKLEDREINVYYSGHYKFDAYAHTYGVRMDRKGTAKTEKDMTICNRVSRRYDQWKVWLVASCKPKLANRKKRKHHIESCLNFLMRIPLLVVGNLLLIPLMLLAFFLFWNPFISIPFLVFWTLYNVILVWKYVRDQRERKDPFYFDCN